MQDSSIQGETTQVDDVVVTGVRPEQPNWLQRRAADVGRVASAIANPASTARDFTSDGIVDMAGVGNSRVGPNRDVLKNTGQEVARAERAQANPGGLQAREAFTSAAGSIENSSVLRAGIWAETPGARNIQDAAQITNRIAKSTQDGPLAVATTGANEGLTAYGDRLGISSGNIGGLAAGAAIGAAVGVAESAGELQNTTRGVRALAQQGVPGYGYEEREVDGRNVQVYVDATREGANPWVVVKHDNSNPLGSDDVSGNTRAFSDAVANRTEAGMEQYRQDIEAAGGASPAIQHAALVREASATAIAEARQPNLITPQAQMAAAPTVAPAI